MNGTRPVSKATAERVREAFSALDYQPNPAARVLRGLPAERIGLIVANSASPFWSAAIKGVEQVAYEMGYNLLLCDSDEDPAKEITNFKMLSGEKVDGIIFAPTSQANAQAIRDLNIRIPLVQIARKLESVPVDSVTCDNLSGGFKATKHLIALGHRRIACISSNLTVSPGHDRLTGYKIAIEESGSEVNPNLILEVSLGPEGGYEAAQNLLRGNPPDAIFACNHLQAFGILQALRERQIRVPEDLALIAYDDMPWSPFIDPPLTVVRQPIAYMAGEAARLLISRLEERFRHRHSNRQPLMHQQRVVGIELVDRTSCGLPERHRSLPVFDAAVDRTGPQHYTSLED